MRRIFCSLIVALAGCQYEGLSPHQVSGQNYSLHALTMYDNMPETQYAPAELRLPARVAVAQVGEVAPVEAMLNKLRSDARIFSRVEGIPSADASEPRALGYWERSTATGSSPRDDMRKMREFARSIGCDYLLISGGEISSESAINNFSVLNLTIVGAFIIPGEDHRAEARANAVLIDLRTGRAVLSASTTESRKGAGATMTQNRDQQRLVGELRDSVVLKLSDEVLAQCRAHKRGFR